MQNFFNNVITGILGQLDFELKYLSFDTFFKFFFKFSENPNIVLVDDKKKFFNFFVLMQKYYFSMNTNDCPEIAFRCIYFGHA